jgi:hypothetical protein
MTENGMAFAQAGLHPLGGDLVRAHQRHDQAVMTGSDAPQVEIGHARAHFPLHHLADIARELGVGFGVEQYEARVADEPERPGGDDCGPHNAHGGIEPAKAEQHSCTERRDCQN